ncbi:MAG: hypothetical protein ACQETB_08635 [Halobacteriota archaeon]
MQRSDTRSSATDEPGGDLGIDTQSAGDSTTQSVGDPTDSERTRESISRIGVDGRWFSAKAFVLSAVLIAVGAFLGGSIPLVGAIGRFIGIFGAAFVIGVLVRHRRYLEVGASGAIVLTGSFALGLLSVGVLPVGVDILQQYGVAVAGVGAVAGGAIAAVGHYFGRDLREGLTKTI